MRPTAEEVRAHAERYPIHGGKAGRWRVYRAANHWCAIVDLYIMTSGVIAGWPSHWGSWRPGDDVEWSALDQAGNPLVLLEANEDLKRQVTHSLTTMEHLRRMRDEALDTLAMCKEQRDWYMKQQGECLLELDRLKRQIAGEV